MGLRAWAHAGCECAVAVDLASCHLTDGFPLVGLLRRCYRSGWGLCGDEGSWCQGIVRIDIVAQIVRPPWNLGVVLVNQ